jgi:hypothetical protein
VSREKWNETRRARKAKPPESYEELTEIQKSLLDLAVFEGGVLAGGARMAAYVSAAGLLTRKGLLRRQEGTRNFYEPTPSGLALYAARKKR